jgi:tetratricopeptide (TPR) repeat protein
MSTSIVESNQNDVVKQCEALWEKITDINQNLSVDQKIDSWRQNKNECPIQDIFDYRYAKLLVQAHRFGEVRNIVKKYLKIDTPYLKEFKEVLVSAQFVEVANMDAPGESDWEKINKGFLRLTEEYPDWYRGYLGLSSLAMVFNDYDNTIKFAQIANSKQQSASAYKNLTIAYMQLDNYQKALENGEMAYTLDNNLLSDREYMLALAISLVVNNNFDDAKAILATLVKYQPQVEHDKGFQNAVKYLRAKLQQEKSE